MIWMPLTPQEAGGLPGLGANSITNSPSEPGRTGENALTTKPSLPASVGSEGGQQGGTVDADVHRPVPSRARDEMQAHGVHPVASPAAWFGASALSSFLRLWFWRRL